MRNSLAALTILLGAWVSGCSTAAPGLRLTSVDHRQSFRQPFAQAYSRSDGKGNIDIVLLDSAAQQNLAGNPSAAPIRQIMHIRVLWTPSREMKAVATNAAIKWYVIGDASPQDYLEYSGTGFVYYDTEDNTTTVRVQNAMLKPSDRHGNLIDPVGISKLEGTIIARTDPAQVRRVLNDLNVSMAQADR